MSKTKLYIFSGYDITFMNLTLDFHASLSFNLIFRQALNVNKRKSISDKSQYMIYAFRDLFVCFFVFLHFFPLQ